MSTTAATAFAFAPVPASDEAREIEQIAREEVERLYLGMYVHEGVRLKEGVPLKCAWFQALDEEIEEVDEVRIGVFFGGQLVSEVADGEDPMEALRQVREGHRAFVRWVHSKAL